MSYISGNLSNFASRLHQSPTGVIDLNSLRLESELYTGNASYNEINKWNTEYNRQYWKFTNDPTHLTGQDLFVPI